MVSSVANKRPPKREDASEPEPIWGNRVRWIAEKLEAGEIAAARNEFAKFTADIEAGRYADFERRLAELN